MSTEPQSAENTSEEKSVETHDSARNSYFVEGRYRVFTNVYGVYQGYSFKHNQKGRMVSRHTTLESANAAAEVLLTESGCTSSKINGALSGEAVAFDRDDMPSIVKVCVEELPLDKLSTLELQQLVLEYDIPRQDNGSSLWQMSKSDLIEMVYPTICHKVHLNRRSEKDLLHCPLCQELYKEEYEQDPTAIRRKLQSQMHRKNLIRPITQKQIEKEYGKNVLTIECLSDGVTQQKLHWHQKQCFSTTYNVYERDEIQKYYDEIIESRKNEENDEEEEEKEKTDHEEKKCKKNGKAKRKKEKASSRKRKKCDEDGDKDGQPHSKKTKIDEYFRQTS